MGSVSKWCPELVGWKRLPAIALALSVAGCMAVGSDMSKARPDQKEPGKKVGSGKSFIDQTTVAVAPAAPPGGWDSERVMSGQDDWEPASAVDPVNQNFVYQLTTRYTGP